MYLSHFGVDFVVLLQVDDFLSHVSYVMAWFSLVYLLCNVTFNDISVINCTTNRCESGLKKLDLWSGSQRHRHFVAFFNVPVQAPTWCHLPRNWTPSFVQWDSTNLGMFLRPYA